MQYPHWMMVAGAALVVVGFLGFAFRKNNAASDENDSDQTSPTEEPSSARQTLGASYLGLVIKAMFDPTPELPNDTLTIMVRFPTRVRNALEYAGLKTIGEVRETSDADLRRIPDLGNESVRYLRKMIGSGPAGTNTRPG
jgi:hypothetical protein